MSNRPGDVLSDLLEFCPHFLTTWESEAYLWTDDDGIFTFCGVFAAFSHYIAIVLRSSELPDLEAVFQYVEHCIHNNEDLGTAAATCFLENLMNRIPEEIAPEPLMSLLGTDSREHCRAWDQFCGVQTERLW